MERLEREEALKAAEEAAKEALARGEPIPRIPSGLVQVLPFQNDYSLILLPKLTFFV